MSRVGPSPFVYYFTFYSLTYAIIRKFLYHSIIGEKTLVDPPPMPHQIHMLPYQLYHAPFLESEAPVEQHIGVGEHTGVEQTGLLCSKEIPIIAEKLGQGLERAFAFRVKRLDVDDGRVLEQLRFGGRAQIVREGGANEHIGRARGDVGREGGRGEVGRLEVEEVELRRTMLA